MIHKAKACNMMKKQIYSQGKYINLQSMIRKIFGPIKHSHQSGLILSLYLIFSF